MAAIDFRPTELVVRCKEEVTYTMSITHKKTRETAAGSGDNKFALECRLLDKLRERVEKNDERRTD